MAEVSLAHFLVVAVLLLVLGLMTALTRRRATEALMGIILMYSAAALAFCGVNRFLAGARLTGTGEVEPLVTGQLFAIFILVIAVAHTALTVSLILSLHRQGRSTDLDEASELAG